MRQWRKHRMATEYPVTLVAERTSSNVKIVDVNEDGVGLLGTPNLPDGTAVRLEFMHHRVDAKILWQKGNLAGATFDRQIDGNLMDWMRCAVG